MTDCTRSPPRLVDLRCPHCGRLWMRFVHDGGADLAEIKCGCKRLLEFRVSAGRVVVIGTRNGSA